jgi:hypothetical protein
VEYLTDAHRTAVREVATGMLREPAGSTFQLLDRWHAQVPTRSPASS